MRCATARTTPRRLTRLDWLEGEFAELLDAAVRRSGGIDLFALFEQALHMDDDGHSRQKAASALFANIIAPFIAEVGLPVESSARALRFLAQNDIFFLPLTMAAAKSAMLAAEGISGAGMVTAIAFNGATCPPRGGERGDAGLQHRHRSPKS